MVEVEERERCMVAGLPWEKTHEHVEPDISSGRNADDETWNLDVGGVFVWVKNYTRGFENWRGWRIGRGGSPLIRLNDGEPWPTREAAMEAAARVARKSALDHLWDAREQLSDAIRAVQEVTLP